MNSRLLVLVALLVTAVTAAGALGRQETVYYLNGIAFFFRDGRLVDKSLARPLAEEAPNDRKRYYQGGSKLGQALLNEAARSFANESSIEEDFVFESLGSSLAARGLLDGKLDWAFMSRELLPAEKEAGLKAVTVAWDAMFVVVPRDLPVENVSVKALAAIYAGTMANWKELGGPDLPILPCAYSELSGNAGALRDMVLEKVFGDDGRLTPRARLLDQDALLYHAVAGKPGSIGFGANSFNLEEPDPRVKFLRVDGVDLDTEEIRVGRYPLIRPLNFVTVGDPRGRAEDILARLLGERIQSTLPDRKLVPVF